ncbi:porin [Massilia cavernae]|uniref:Porin n=1 Tax=Massilia cavernae TaxID=2320864 RepID=A0A418XH06_9BURK|nr:porin [Massilia cavernae]RJG11749.1 porin [Massilia cavernae]
MKASYLAVTALCICAGTANAQSPVTVYGLMDTDGKVESACEGCDALHTGLSVVRPYSFRYLSLLDVGEAFDGTVAGPFTIGRKRARKHISGTVQYYTRDSDKLFADSRYGLVESHGTAPSNRAWGISLGLEQNRIMLRAAHQNKNVAKVSPAMALGNTLAAKNSIIAANVQLGAAKVYAAYSASRGWGSSPLWNPDNPYGAALAATPSTDSRDKLVGIAVPFGETTLLASFIRKNDRDLANHDADQLALGATYAISRRTDFYTTWSLTKSRSISGTAIDSSIVPGSMNRAINIGMRHSF